MGRENRRDPRVNVELDVFLPTARGEDRYVTKDIAYRGIFVVTPNPYPLRKLVRFRASLDGVDVQMMGLVAHRVNAMDAEERGTQPGMGVSLFSVGHSARQEWRDYVRTQYELDPEARRQVEIDEMPRLRIHLASQDMLRQFIDRDFPSGSIFYRMPELQPVGTRVRLEVIHPESREMFELEATVTEVVEEPRHKRGVRVAFDEMSEATESRFHDFDTSQPSLDELSVSDLEFE
jgi:hypothetical protein